MTKSELAAAMTKLRMTKLAESQGHSKEEAEVMAETAIKQGGIKGMKAMATPDGTIVTIIDTYLQYITRRTLELGGQDQFKQANDEAISAIENHRKTLGGTSSNYPKDIDAYVYYRLNKEIQNQYGQSADSMGFDRETVKMLTHTAKLNLTKYVYQDQKNGSKKCFIATACYGSPEAPNVLSLRKYRERVLRKSSLGRWSIYWYYKASPSIAKYLEHNEKARLMTRKLLGVIARLVSD